MVRLRLQRHGRKKLPFYHIVAADIRAKRDGRIIEDLGRFSPTQEPSLLRLETSRVVHWLKNGAQPSDTVRSILKKEGVFYRLHLERWGRSEEEIEATIAEWREERNKKKKAPATKAEKMKAQLKAEEEKFRKEQEEKEKAAAEKAKIEAEEAKAAKAKQEEEEVARQKAESADSSEAENKEATKPVKQKEIKAGEKEEKPADEGSAEASEEKKA